MGNEIARNIETLKDAPLRELQETYLTYFPGKKVSINRTYLWRRVVYRSQELEYGELVPEAKIKLKTLKCKGSNLYLDTTRANFLPDGVPWGSIVYPSRGQRQTYVFLNY